MRWIDGVPESVEADMNWSSRLKDTRLDPYLLWHQTCGFKGLALPVDLEARTVLPIISEASTGTFRTSHVPATAIAQLLRDVREHRITRFELGGAVVNDRWHAPAVTQRVHRVSALTPARRGQGDVVGFIDYGCAFAHQKWRRTATSQHQVDTRVRAIWDQEASAPSEQKPPHRQKLQWRTPPDFGYGAETHRDVEWADGCGLRLGDYVRQFVKDGVVDEPSCYRHSGHQAIADKHATHGTHVIDIATGHPHAADAHDADIVFVQLPKVLNGRSVAGLLRAHVLDALTFIFSCADENANVVINLSYGGTAGPHDGTSILEEAMDALIRSERAKRPGKTVEIVVAAGNSGQAALHATAAFKSGRDVQSATFHWHNTPDDPSDSFVEFWFPEDGHYNIEVIPPGHGQPSGDVARGGAATYVLTSGPVAALIYPASVCQSHHGSLALLAVAPTQPGLGRQIAPYGIWKVIVHAHDLKNAAQVHAYCERDEPGFGSFGTPRQSVFSDTETSSVDLNGTLNSLAHGAETLVVGSSMGQKIASPSSATGPGRGMSTSEPCRNLHGEPQRGPAFMQRADETAGQPGLTAAAVIGTDTIRLAGTSVAAAMLTRTIVSNGFRVPPQPKITRVLQASAVRRCPEDAHPDASLSP